MRCTIVEKVFPCIWVLLEQSWKIENKMQCCFILALLYWCHDFLKLSFVVCSWKKNWIVDKDRLMDIKVAPRGWWSCSACWHIVKLLGEWVVVFFVYHMCECKVGTQILRCYSLWKYRLSIVIYQFGFVFKLSFNINWNSRSEKNAACVNHPAMFRKRVWSILNSGFELERSFQWDIERSNNTFNSTKKRHPFIFPKLACATEVPWFNVWTMMRIW